MERKLASIQKIVDINPIPNADAIERATVLGWNLVVKKGEFKPGDLCIYCEVDSLLPVKDEYEFLRKSCFNSRLNGFRIKTVKLRGQISQGIAFPVGILDIIPASLEPGLDVTDVLDIRKYEAEIPTSLGGQVKGGFPSFIPKTDEIRIQSVPGVLERYDESTNFIATEKVDGTSVTYYFKDGEFGVCGRNWDLKESEENTYWQVARKYDIEEKMKVWNRNIAIQGEILGPGIQKNKYAFNEHKVFFFNVFNIDSYTFYDHMRAGDLLYAIGLEKVPVVARNVYLPEVMPTMEAAVEFSIGKSLLNDIQREGVVLRPYVEQSDHELGRLSFKIINPKFLLKYDE